MIKSYLILALAIGFMLGLGSMSIPEPTGADHGIGDSVLLHNICFEIFGLENIEKNINENVLECEQVMLLWEIRDKLIGSPNENDSMEIIFTSSTKTIGL